MRESYPRFAVVGHPNKGKSSIVSTLAMDESVEISDRPGTTVKKRPFPFTVDGRILYELYDTPGFQRPGAILEWLQMENPPAHLRSERVREFVSTHHDDPRFADDIELLKPILDGAAVIYVVDGSKPYGMEFEAEMEILRYSGKPSMAIINKIGSHDFSEEWNSALGHYFRLIRRFNPMKADFPQIVSLLESMAQLDEKWTESVKEAIEKFRSLHELQMRRSAREIALLLQKISSHTESMNISEGDDTAMMSATLQERFRNSISRMEKRSISEIAAIWRHGKRKISENMEILEGTQLFSREAHTIFGLEKRDLLLASAAAGAAAGAAIDASLGGSSLFAGTLLGALTGAVGTYRGFDKIADIEILGRKTGSRKIVMGPPRDSNLLFIVLSRVLYFTIEIARRPHADRSEIAMGEMREFVEKLFSRQEIRKISSLHGKMAKRGKEDIRKEYEKLILQILKKKIDG
jgi:GTPase Era involved in 16S rRNA processing/ribosomal protein L31E